MLSTRLIFVRRPGLLPARHFPYTAAMDLAGKTAFITGGGTGIGLATARALKAHGAKVIIAGRRRAVLDEAATEGFTPCVVDVSDESSVIEAFEQSGQIDIIVANAGIAKGQNILSKGPSLWREIMATNLDGAYWTIREGLRRMDTTRYGRVIAIASIAGLRGLQGAHAYTASKHGLVGLIRGLAADFTGTEVTFNAICPGYVDTPIVTENIDHLKARLGLDDAAALKVMTDQNPHGRLISAEEVAASVCHLCDPLSGSITGTTIEISGGAR
ncbi:MAG: SDR family oxidoreductase [Pseudomonadota bacterium]